MIGPVTLQPNEGNRGGTTIINSTFSGYNNDGCTGNFDKAIVVENDQVRNAVFDSKHTLIGNTFADSDNRISACASINNSADGWVRYVTLEDVDGSLSGVGPGFFVQDEAAVTNFVDRDQCIEFEGACLLFCPSECLRLGIVKISQDLTTRGWSMRIVDGEKSGTVGTVSSLLYVILWNMHCVVPALNSCQIASKYGSTSFRAISRRRCQ